MDTISLMERTLLLIKPDGVQRGLIGKIITEVENADLVIVNMRLIHLSREDAEKFYSVHKAKPFFRKLVNFVTKDRIVAIELEGENVIKRVRSLIGTTDPKKAEKGTIREKYGLDMTVNTVHASDSKETARSEIRFFFDEED